jgi:hypothetical protein
MGASAREAARPRPDGTDFSAIERHPRSIHVACRLSRSVRVVPSDSSESLRPSRFGARIADAGERRQASVCAAGRPRWPAGAASCEDAEAASSITGDVDSRRLLIQGILRPPLLLPRCMRCGTGSTGERGASGLAET